VKKSNIKKTLEPQQVTVVVDTREQTPVIVSPLKSICRGLPTGDYSVLGLEHVVAVERKSLQDLIQCVGKERERFEKEVQRLLAYPVRALVVEGKWAQIELKQYRGDVHPNAAMGSILGWVAQGLPVLMVDDHASAGRYISRICFLAARRRWLESHQFMSTVISTEPEMLKLSSRNQRSQTLPRQAV